MIRTLAFLKDIQMRLLFASVLTMILFLTISESSFAENNNAPPLESKPYLAWEITSKDINATIVGSIHYTATTTYPLPEHIEARFLSSSSLILETFEGEDVASAVLKELRAFDSGDSICKRLSAIDCDSFHKRLYKLRLNPSVIDRYKPWFAAMTLSGLDVQNWASGLGVDEYFQRRALERQQPIFQLEPLHTLFSSFDSVSMEEQVAALKESLAPIDHDELLSIERYWQLGDISNLLKISASEDGRTSPLLVAADQREMQKRNEAMVVKLQEWLKDIRGKNAFISVGYLHLVGEGNMLDRLRDMGFTVRRLPL